MLRQALLPEEAHRHHNAPAQQDGRRHAQEACRDAPQVCGRTHTRTHTVISAGNEGTQNIAVVTTPWYCYIKLMVCFRGNSDWQ